MWDNNQVDFIKSVQLMVAVIMVVLSVTSYDAKINIKRTIILEINIIVKDSKPKIIAYSSQTGVFTV